MRAAQVNARGTSKCARHKKMRAAQVNARGDHRKHENAFRGPELTGASCILKTAFSGVPKKRGASGICRFCHRINPATVTFLVEGYDIGPDRRITPGPGPRVTQDMWFWSVDKFHMWPKHCAALFGLRNTILTDITISRWNPFLTKISSTTIKK